MAKTLRAVGFDVIDIENASQTDMKKAISDFGNRLTAAGRDATGLVFYAGHGVQVNGENYLISDRCADRKGSGCGPCGGEPYPRSRVRCSNDRQCGQHHHPSMPAATIR